MQRIANPRTPVRFRYSPPNLFNDFKFSSLLGFDPKCHIPFIDLFRLLTLKRCSLGLRFLMRVTRTLDSQTFFEIPARQASHSADANLTHQLCGLRLVAPTFALTQSSQGKCIRPVKSNKAFVVSAVQLSTI